jgi:putative transposase
MHEPYQRRLPHRMPPGETLFITFRLHGTVPFDVLCRLKEDHEVLVQTKIQSGAPIEALRKQLESHYFASFDTYLDGCSSDANWLSDDPIARLVISSLHFGDKTSYDLHAFCIMPNHVHLLVTVLTEQVPFFAIL